MATAERLVSVGTTDLVAQIPLTDTTVADDTFRTWVDALSPRVKQLGTDESQR